MACNFNEDDTINSYQSTLSQSSQILTSSQTSNHSNKKQFELIRKVISKEEVKSFFNIKSNINIRKTTQNAGAEEFKSCRICINDDSCETHKMKVFYKTCTSTICNSQTNKCPVKYTF